MFNSSSLNSATSTLKEVGFYIYIIGVVSAIYMGTQVFFARFRRRYYAVIPLSLQPRRSSHSPRALECRAPPLLIVDLRY